MKKYKLDPEEAELLKEIEAGNYRVITTPELIKEAQLAARNTLRRLAKNKSISLRLNEDDLSKFKEKAERKGLKYQTIISLFVHKYAYEEIDLVL